MIQIALDIMGGDNAPYSNIDGAIQFLNDYKDVKLYLVGDKHLIESEFVKKTNFTQKNYEIISTSQIVLPDDKPSKIIKNKPNSSMNKAICLLKNNDVGAVISSGNTGCLVSSAFFNLGTINNIKRPALFALIPCKKGDFLICDVGANTSPKPEQLLQYAEMATVYIQNVQGIKNPKLALLNIGSESNKGTDLIKSSFNLLSNNLENFVGNIESRYIFDGKADIIICDGFTGNITLKLIEGMMIYNYQLIADKLRLKDDDKINELKSIYDYELVGATPILGINGLVLKSHGSSTEKSIYNALKSAKKLIEINLISRF
tara:strand:+ start:12259 stop:13209 length:951 start_codon:yes stop_codon:yes gene_type:complete